MSSKKSFLTSILRVAALLLLVCLPLALVLAQDPSGRPTEPSTKGKKQPKRTPTKVEPQPITVTLTVLTDPPQSTVFINGDERGVTNSEGKAQFDKLLPGHYTVEVRKEGYAPQLQGFNAGTQTPTLVFKLEPNFDQFNKQFDSLIAANKLTGPDSPNALELVSDLATRFPDKPEVVRMRGVLSARLLETVTHVINNSASNWRAVSRDEIARALESANRALELKKDDTRIQSEVAYLKGALALFNWQHAGAPSSGGKPAIENEAGGLATARAEFENAVRLDESFAAARYQLGIVLLASGDAAGAEANFVRAVQLEPKWAFAQIALGSAYHAQGRYKDAIDAYRKAIEHGQNQAAAYAGLGLSRAAKGEKDGVKDIERAMKIDPNSALPHLNLGLALALSKNKKDWIRAEEEIKRAMQMNANNAEFQNSVAERALADLQQRKKK